MDIYASESFGPATVIHPVESTDATIDLANGSQLFREIRERGNAGSYSVVRSYLNQRRTAKAPLAQAPPTVRDVAGWLTRHPASLTEDERPRLKAVLDRCPELQAASGQVRSFAIMIAQLAGQDPRSGSAAPAPLTCRACRPSPRACSRTWTPSPRA